MSQSFDSRRGPRLTPLYDQERGKYELRGLILMLGKDTRTARSHSCHNGECPKLDDLDVMANFLVHSKTYAVAPMGTVDGTIWMMSPRDILNTGACTHGLVMDQTC